MWAVDCLTALGFKYSSSVLPAAHPLYGFPGAPNLPFRWPTGLVELPVPIHRVLGKNLPYLGGVYLRYLPSKIALRWARAKPSAQVLWTYCHPYDFDSTEPFCRIKGANFLTSMILWLNRENTLVKIGNILSGTSGAPLRERVVELEQNSGLVDYS